MNTCLFALTLIALCEYAQAGRDRRNGLYEPTDNLTIFTNNNFYEKFLDKENAWVIEFYNSWCGHCINFAPTWKKFGSYTKGWERVLSVGAVDCANSNNSVVCRVFSTRGYPTMLYFKPHMSMGYGNGTGGEISSDNVLSGGQAFDTLLRVTHKFLDSIANSTPPASWPKLKPLRSIEEIWTEAKDHHEYVFLIFEDERSKLGKEVILDTMNHPSLLVRRMFKQDVSKFGINVFPSLYSLNKDGIYNKVLFGNGDIHGRRNFVSAIYKSSGTTVTVKQLVGSESKVTKEKEEVYARVRIIKDKQPLLKDEAVGEEEHEKNEKSQEANTKSNVVYMKDLESALQYSLKQEVAIKNSMDEEVLQSLTSFITILTKYFPGAVEILTYLMKVKNWLQDTTAPLSGEEWIKQLNALQDDSALLPDDQQWVACGGSELRYRGYPCGMWTMFHTLTVASHLSHHRTNPQDVLLAIRGYMKHFFGCDECSKNFYKMAATLETEVHTKEDTVLWLWRAHNKANKRLHGDLSEDPEHPKIQFPSQSACPACHKSSGTAENPIWDEDQVLNYLVALYRPENIAIDNKQTQLKTNTQLVRKEGELDWWEKMQRAQDLMKIQELRHQKKRAGQQKMEREIWQQAKQQEYRRKEFQAIRKGWGLNGVDLGMCMMFYVMCAVIILLMYYHFTIRRNWKPCGCLPI